MALQTFCGLLTLQVGVAVLAVVYFTIAGIVIVANAFDYLPEEEGLPLNVVVLIIFVSGLIMIGVIMLTSSYKENRSMAIASLVFIIILVVFWFVLCYFSFMGSRSQVESVCRVSRCPESFWIVSVSVHPFRLCNCTEYPYLYPHYYRNERSVVVDERSLKQGSSVERETSRDMTFELRNILFDVGVSTSSPRNSTEKIATWSVMQPLNSSALGKIMDFEYIYPNQMNSSSTSIKHEFENKSGLLFGDFLKNTTNTTSPDDSPFPGHPTTGAIVIFLMNLLFFIFTAISVLSWVSELNAYDDDDDDSEEEEEEPELDEI